MDDMYQPAALFIGLRYMRGRAADRFGRFVSWLSTIGITLGVMALVTVLSVMNGFERELQNNILGLMPQAILSAKQGSVNPNSCRSARRNSRASPAWRRSPPATWCCRARAAWRSG
jgi:ABC-type lipoprotein release transport system permease subunit